MFLQPFSHMRTYKILSFFIKAGICLCINPNAKVFCLPDNIRFATYQKASILYMIRKMPNPLRAAFANMKMAHRSRTII